MMPSWRWLLVWILLLNVLVLLQYFWSHCVEMCFVINVSNLWSLAELDTKNIFIHHLWRSQQTLWDLWRLRIVSIIVSEQQLHAAADDDDEIVENDLTVNGWECYPRKVIVTTPAFENWINFHCSLRCQVIAAYSINTRYQSSWWKPKIMGDLKQSEWRCWVAVSLLSLTGWINFCRLTHHHCTVRILLNKTFIRLLPHLPGSSLNNNSSRSKIEIIERLIINSM